MDLDQHTRRMEQSVSSSGGGSIATPLVRGVVAAAVSLGTVLAITVVPALAAQIAGSGSSATALDAVLIALNLLVLGHGGGVTLGTGVIEGATTLTPLGLSLLFVAVSALGMRRVGRGLDLVRDDGVLRTRALRDAGGALGAYTAVYAVGMAVVGALGRSGEASPVIASALVSAALIAVVGGLLGLLWSVRREATATVPAVRVLALLPSPFDAVARAVLLALGGLVAAATAFVVVLLVISIPGQSALFDQLAPGVVGGAVLTLLQLALLPLLIVWAMAVLLGGTVSVGSGTALSLHGVESGVLPALPMLAAIPQPGAAPVWVWALLVLPIAAVVLGAYRLVRDTAGFALRDRVTAWVAYPVLVVVAVLLVAGLSTGRIGEGRLVHLGPVMSTMLLPLLGIVVLSTAAVIGLLATPAVPWMRGLVGSLRERVERAEQEERGVGVSRSEVMDDDAADADSTGSGASTASDAATAPDASTASDAEEAEESGTSLAAGSPSER